MLKRYIGKTGEDRIEVTSYLASFSIPGETERFVTNEVMTDGSIAIPLPINKGIIERIVFNQKPDPAVSGAYDFAFALWYFRAPTPSAVRKTQKNFTSAELDTIIGYSNQKTGDAPGTPTDVWVFGESTPEAPGMLQKNVNIPFVIPSENPILYIVAEYTGASVRIGDVDLYVTLHLKRD